MPIRLFDSSSLGFWFYLNLFIYFFLGKMHFILKSNIQSSYISDESHYYCTYYIITWKIPPNITNHQHPLFQCNSTLYRYNLVSCFLFPKNFQYIHTQLLTLIKEKKTAVHSPTHKHKKKKKSTWLPLFPIPSFPTSISTLFTKLRFILKCIDNSNNF